MINPSPDHVYVVPAPSRRYVSQPRKPHFTLQCLPEDYEIQLDRYSVDSSESKGLWFGLFRCNQDRVGCWPDGHCLLQKAIKQLEKSSLRSRRAGIGTRRIPTDCVAWSKQYVPDNADSGNPRETEACADTPGRLPQSQSWTPVRPPFADTLPSPTPQHMG